MAFHKNIIPQKNKKTFYSLHYISQNNTTKTKEINF